VVVGPAGVELLAGGVVGTVLDSTGVLERPPGVAVWVIVRVGAALPDVHADNAAAASANMLSATALRCFVLIRQAVMVTRPPVFQVSHGTFQSP